MGIRLDLKAKLFLCFGAVTVVMILLGVFLISMVKTMSDETTALYKDNYGPVRGSLDVEFDTVTAALAVDRYIDASTEEEQTAARELYDHSVAGIREETLPALHEATTEADHQEALDTFEHNFNQAVTSWEAAMALADGGDMEGAEETSHQADSVTAAALEAINQAVDRGEKHFVAVAETAADDYVSARNLSSTLLVMVAAVTTAGAWFLARSIDDHVASSAASVSGSTNERASDSAEASAPAEETPVHAGVASAAGE